MITDALLCHPNHVPHAPMPFSRTPSVNIFVLSGIGARNSLTRSPSDMFSSEKKKTKHEPKVGRQKRLPWKNYDPNPKAGDEEHPSRLAAKGINDMPAAVSRGKGRGGVSGETSSSSADGEEDGDGDVAGDNDHDETETAAGAEAESETEHEGVEDGPNPNDRKAAVAGSSAAREKREKMAAANKRAEERRAKRKKVKEGAKL